MICAHCNGDIAAGTCLNCGMPAGSLRSSVSEPPGLQELPPLLPEMGAAEPGLAAVLAASGDDPNRPEMEGTPARCVRALLSLTFGYDTDPASVFEPSATLLSPNSATLSVILPVRTACERCMLPVFGTIESECVPGRWLLDGGHVLRLVEVLAARYQTEAQLAEQVAAGLVDLGGAAYASVRVTARRPCDECGAGRVEITARAMRSAPAGGDPQQQQGGG